MTHPKPFQEDVLSADDITVEAPAVGPTVSVTAAPPVQLADKARNSGLASMVGTLLVALGAVYKATGHIDLGDLFLAVGGSLGVGAGTAGATFITTNRTQR